MCSKPCNSKRILRKIRVRPDRARRSARNAGEQQRVDRRRSGTGKGTIGKLATDDSLFEKYREIGENLASATAKLNSNEGTTGKFFSDPQFYDNMTGLAGDMRLLVGDFRKNPKKFLRVKFSLF